MKTYGFGVDIGGTTVKLGLFRTDGTLLDKWEIPTRTENDGAHILPDVAEAIKGKIAEKAIDPSDVQGVGVGVPGPVTPEGIVRKCVNLGWGVFNVEDTLSELTGYPVKAGNDANVAAFGEMWQGAGKGSGNIVMVTLGTGVGGGVILQGKILTGCKGAGGEIGHMTVNMDETRVCGCGNKGCLEQYASATGIVNMAKENVPEGSYLADKKVTAKAVFDGAKEGDAYCMEVVEKFGRYLGVALSNVAHVVDPEAFVIGGGVSAAGQILLDVVEKYYNENSMFALKNKSFHLAELGNDAGIYGAVRMVLFK